MGEWALVPVSWTNACLCLYAQRDSHPNIAHIVVDMLGVV
jgi:hypothetical protein